MRLRNIAWQSLWRRKAKSAFALLGLVIGVATMVALVSLAEALTEEVNNKIEKYGANMLITPKSESLNLQYEGLSLGGFSFETNVLLEKDLARIRTIENAANVAAVGPTVLGLVKVNDRPVLLSGMDFSTVNILKPWWQPTGTYPGKGELIAGAKAARILGLVQGGEIEIKGRPFRISGVLTSTGSQDDSLIFGNLSEIQELLDKKGQVSLVEVAALCSGCPIDEMVRQISTVLPNASVMAIRSVVKGRMQTLAMFKKFAMGGSILIILVGALLVMVTMMGSIKERTHEIGIFRAIGFRRSHVVRVVLIEAGILSLLAGIIGYSSGMGVGILALPFLATGPEVHIPLNPFVAGGSILLALLVGLLASLYPASMAAHLDPSDALRSL